MKKRMISLLLCASIIMIFMVGCGNGTDDHDHADDSIITISMSDEAKKYEKDVISQDGVKMMLSEENFDQVIKALSSRTEQSFPECEVKNSLDSMDFQGSTVYFLKKEGYENVVLFIHGGAWTFGISEEHVSFCDDLAERLNAKVYIPLYPLAPESDSEETYAVIEGLYQEILKEEKNVYIMGDSAGGNITLGLMYTIKEDNLQKPEKMVLFAPCSDMTFSNKDSEEINQTDPELALYGCRKCAELWAGQENLKKPKYSALCSDVTGYPDTMIIQGTNDILYPDNLILYQNMKNAGVDVTLVIGEGLWHVFPIYPTPEKTKALDLIEAFCAESF